MKVPGSQFFPNENFNTLACWDRTQTRHRDKRCLTKNGFLFKIGSLRPQNNLISHVEALIPDFNRRCFLVKLLHFFSSKFHMIDTLVLTPWAARQIRTRKC